MEEKQVLLYSSRASLLILFLAFCFVCYPLVFQHDNLMIYRQPTSQELKDICSINPSYCIYHNVTQEIMNENYPRLEFMMNYYNARLIPFLLFALVVVAFQFWIKDKRQKE